MGIMIFIVWLILCLVVGAVAQSMERSFTNYFLISIFLSPLIGFIILAIKGRATQDEILNENKHIFYCSNCNSVYSNTGSKEEYCPQCKKLLIETTILAEDWRTYTRDKKEKMKQSFKNGEYSRENIGFINQPVIKQVNNADEIKKYKELLDMGAITQEEFDTKKKQLLDL